MTGNTTHDLQRSSSLVLTIINSKATGGEGNPGFRWITVNPLHPGVGQLLQRVSHWEEITAFLASLLLPAYFPVRFKTCFTLSSSPSLLGRASPLLPSQPVSEV